MEESWSRWLEFYFDAHEVTAADKKHSILLLVCGTNTFEMLKNLVHPQKLTHKSFEDLVADMEKHLNPLSLKLQV